MGAACSRDHLISRLQAAPTRDFYGDLTMGLILKASYAICIIIIPAFLTRLGGLWYTFRIFTEFERIERESFG